MSARLITWNREILSVVARITRCGAVATEVMRTMVGLPPPILISPSTPAFTFSGGTFTPDPRTAAAAPGVMNWLTLRPFFS